MRNTWVLLGMLAVGCTHGPDRAEPAMAAVARVCSASELDPRIVSAHDRACSGGDDRACQMKNADGCRLLDAARVVAPRSHVASLLD